MLRIPLKVLYIAMPLMVALVLVIDGFMAIVTRIDVTLQVSFLAISLQTIHDLMVLGIAFSWYSIVLRSSLLSDLDIPKRLWRLSILLGLNFVAVFLLQLLFRSGSNGSVLDVMREVLFTNTVGLLAITTLIPILILVKGLVFYRQRRTTRLYFTAMILLIIATSLIANATGARLDFTHLFQPPAPFTAIDAYEQVVLAALGFLIGALAVRNDWITYLPRKQKFLYFGIGLVVYTQIATLWEVVYSDTVPAYSLAAGNFAYLMTILLRVYGGVTMATLLVHLPTARAVDRKLRELRSVYNLNQVLNSELDANRLPALITRLTAQVLESQATWLMVPNNGGFDVASHIHLTQAQILTPPFSEPDGLLRTLTEEKRPVLINDISQNRQLTALARWKPDARAMIAAPLLSSRDQLLGLLCATQARPYAFDIDDLSLLESYANQSAIALENLQLLKASFEKERMEQELKVAREVQLKLVPTTLPPIGGFELESYFLTAYEVGGDYYDTITFADGRPGLVIGDVSGKGTSAAFYMAEFKGVIQTLAHTTGEPRELMCRTNRIMYSIIERQTFVTAIVAKLYPEEGRIQFVRAGHPPLVRYSPDRDCTAFLQPPGLGIGLDSGDLFDTVLVEETLQLRDGEVLLMCTDGVLELRNGRGEEFGEERLRDLLPTVRTGSAAAFKTALLEAITTFVDGAPLHDDLIFLVIRHGVGSVLEGGATQNPNFNFD